MFAQDLRMTDYFADSGTVLSKKQAFSYVKLNSDNELIGEKEINFLDYTESWDLLNKTEIHPNKNKFTKPLSDLGKALSETISKLTRDKRFKSGDKVELILEIELVKSHSPNKSSKRQSKHSIVEVTIIQHRVPEEEPVFKPTKRDRPLRTVPYRLVPCNSESETASAKRRKWFERVVYNKTVRYNDVQNVSKNTTGMYGDYNTKYSTVNYQNMKWCETNIDSENINYETKRLVPKIIQRRRYKSRVRRQQCEAICTGFLPASKANKSKEVEKAFSELKEKVDYIMQGDNPNTNSVKKKRGPIPALGKLVSNILVGVIDRTNSNSLKNSFKNTRMLNNELKDNTNQKMGKFCRIMGNTSKHLNQEVTQILKPRNLCDTSNMELSAIKSPRAETVILKQNEKHKDRSLMYNDFNADKKILPEYRKNDLKVKKKIGNDKVEELFKRNENKQVEGKMTSTSSDQSWVLKIEKKKKSKPKDDKMRLKNQKKNKGENFSFEGKSLKLSSELKRKIETLIVNELQNLALKEGMECDISPLPSTTECIIHYDLKSSISEIQSFYCEVDLDDKAIEKVKGNIRVSNSKKGREIFTEIKQDKMVCKDRKYSQVNNHKQCYNENVKADKLNTITETEDKCEITYINPAVRNWSNESESLKTVILSRPKVLEIKDESTAKNGFIKQLQSDDTIWKNANFVDKSETVTSQLITQSEPSKTSTSNKISDTTNEYCSNIEIELDIKDMENILEQAKANCITDKFLINATRSKKKKRKNKSCFTNKSKNSSSYTETVLNEAAKKLENHLKRKQNKQRKIK